MLTPFLLVEHKRPPICQGDAVNCLNEHIVPVIDSLQIQMQSFLFVTIFFTILVFYYCLLLIAYCLLPIAYCLLLIAYSLQPPPQIQTP